MTQTETGAHAFKRILITGARGFLGRAVYPLTQSAFPDAEIVAVGRNPVRHPLDPEGPCRDLTRPQDWLDLGGPFDLVFHLAAAIPGKGQPQDFKNTFIPNAAMAANLFEACREWRPAKIVHASSISVYPLASGQPLKEDIIPAPDSIYGISKLASEHYCNLISQFGVQVVNLRLSSLYGPYQREWHQRTVMNIFLNQVLDGKSPTLFGSGNRKQDFIYSSDAAMAFIRAAAVTRQGTFNIGHGASVSMLELAKTITRLFGAPHQHPTVIPGEKEDSSVLLDTALARETLGFYPQTSLEDGIRRMVESKLSG